MRTTHRTVRRRGPSPREGASETVRRSGSRASSRRTRKDILGASKRVLATHGYARFTLRRVAREAGVTVGNLVYHYPTKRTLVRALIALLIDEYSGQIASRMNGAPGRSPAALSALITWLMRDSVSTETSRLFREFWTLALHDPFVARAMDRFYAEVQETAALHLRHGFPRLSKSAVRGIVQLMGIISEGANVLYATARRPTAPLKQVATLASDLLVHAATRSR